MTLTVVLWSEGDIILLVEMTGCAVMFLLLIILSCNSIHFLLSFGIQILELIEFCEEDEELKDALQIE